MRKESLPLKDYNLIMKLDNLTLRSYAFLLYPPNSKLKFEEEHNS